MRKMAAGWAPRAGFGGWGNAGAGRPAPPTARAPRQLVAGGRLPHHGTHLVLDGPDSYNVRRYSCQITNVSELGFGVRLRVPGALATAFRPGTRLNLEPAVGRPERVEVRWVKGERLGIRRLQPASRGSGEPGQEENEWIVERRVGRQSQWWNCQLILDRPDAMGVRRHVCRIVYHSEKGFCVTVAAAYSLPEIRQVGARLDLEQPNGRRVRVEVRWIKKGRVGMMLLPRAVHS